MRRFLLCAGLVAVSVAPASACINDIELVTHEREFRSQYGQPPKQPDAAPAASVDQTQPMILGAVGITLVLGAVALTLNNTRTRG